MLLWPWEIRVTISRRNNCMFVFKSGNIYHPYYYTKSIFIYLSLLFVFRNVLGHFFHSNKEDDKWGKKKRAEESGSSQGSSWACCSPWSYPSDSYSLWDCCQRAFRYCISIPNRSFLPSWHSWSRASVWSSIRSYAMSKVIRPIRRRKKEKHAESAENSAGQTQKVPWNTESYPNKREASVHTGNRFPVWS